MCVVAHAAWDHQSLTIANEEAEVRRLVIVYPSGIFMIANVNWMASSSRFLF